MRDYPVIILAAGESSRMGTPKGLVEFGGRYWLERQRADLRRAGLSRHIVVLGFSAEEYLEKIPGLPAVRNPSPELGPFSSLQEGLSCVGPSEKGVYVLPIDVPCAERSTWKQLGDAMSAKVQAVVPRFRGMGGHPVLISPDLVAKILLISPDAKDARLDHQLRALADDEIARVAVDDPLILGNFNRPEDFLSFPGKLLASEARK